jgi:hypothetical protein
MSLRGVVEKARLRKLLPESQRAQRVGSLIQGRRAWRDVICAENHRHEGAHLTPCHR